MKIRKVENAAVLVFGMSLSAHACTYTNWSFN